MDGRIYKSSVEKMEASKAHIMYIIIFSFLLSTWLALCHRRPCLLNARLFLEMFQMVFFRLVEVPGQFHDGVGTLASSFLVVVVVVDQAGVLVVIEQVRIMMAVDQERVCTTPTLPWRALQSRYVRSFVDQGCGPEWQIDVCEDWDREKRQHFHAFRRIFPIAGYN